jgi:hypothetical protein
MDDHRDAYGNEIRQGSLVAYNYSGAVRLGTVEAIKPRVRYGEGINKWTNRPFYAYHVKEKSSGKVSKIRYIKNLIAVTA